MQVWIPSPDPRDDGDFAVRDNPGTDGKAFAVVNLSEDGRTALILHGLGDCDRLIKAATRAKEMLLIREAQRQPPVAGHPFVSPGLVAPDLPAPDACLTAGCGLPAAAHPDGAPEGG